MEVTKYLTDLASKNVTLSDKTSFLGVGAYDHYIPSIINHITSRAEFFTSYTPYQPEISQGTTQYIFEFQTLISRLTGMDIANASLYDGGTAVTEAALMCVNSNKEKALVSKSVSPQTRQILNTYLHGQGLECVEIEIKDGVTDLEDLKNKIDGDVGAVIIQSPNFFGNIESVEEATKITHENKKVSFILSADPLSFAILKKPGEMDVDVVVGDAQCFGIPVAFGGPYLGYMAAKKSFMRKLPGRVVGQTVDKNGKRSYVLTLSAREQHIRREKATSNICSNQGLNVLAATIYMCVMGKKGIKEVAVQSTSKAHYLYNKLVESGKFKPLNDKPFFKEFTLIYDGDVDELNKKVKEAGFIGGFKTERYYKDLKGAVTLAVTEKRTKEEMDSFVKVMTGGGKDA